MGSPHKAIKQMLLHLRWLALQSLVKQRQYLPKLKISQQPRERHLNVAESPLGAAGAAGAVEVSEVAEDMEVAD